eukprot:TRINITY_DN9662_c0_g1_i1.p1 TRINITY_DN9662_c0_g1~~TRINITY_DN9662_c0_g1_i1.p1  ORF type:complete len:242 (-),score=73.00 TRINITY_DN9662_c0_g1_i1:59-784(-)
MSKFKVQINYGGEVRYVELDRRAPSSATLRNAVRQKYRLNSDPTLAFSQSNGQKIAVKTDEDLKKALSDSVSGHYLVLEIFGGAPPSAQMRQAAAQPAPAKPQPSQQAQAKPAQVSQPAPAKPQPAASAPAPAAKQAASGALPAGVERSSSALLSYSLSGSGSADKVKIAAAQDANNGCFRFEPTPSKEDTYVEIELPQSKQLLFRISTSKSRLNQTFNIPFDIDSSTLKLQGNILILPFP